MKLKTKSGQLTKYAYACGYIDRFTKENKDGVMLGMENGAFKVVWSIHGLYDRFDCRTLSEARKQYQKLKRQLNKLEV